MYFHLVGIKVDLDSENRHFEVSGTGASLPPKSSLPPTSNFHRENRLSLHDERHRPVRAVDAEEKRKKLFGFKSSLPHCSKPLFPFKY
jgi:hypothetical protein